MFKGKKLLVVDDEQDLREILRDEFVNEGAVVEEAKNGKEAFEKVKANSFDAVLSDIRMHGGDGVTLAKEIKNLDHKKPVVFLITGFADVKNWEAYDLGAEGFVTKPFHLDALRDAVRKSLLPISEKWTSVPVKPATSTIALAKTVSQCFAAKEIVFGRGGFFLNYPPKALRLGDSVKVQFSDGALNGTVRWVRPEEQVGLATGLGIELDYIDPAISDYVRKIIEAVQQRPFIPQA